MNYKLIHTIPDKDYSRVEQRCLEHNGVIVDVGCLLWDWSSFFIGKKRVIGIDPFENEINNAELYKGAITTFDGSVLISQQGNASSINNVHSGINVPCTTWDNFIETYKIDSISILKINIEGGEYDLLNSLKDADFEKIDQIAVSFHEWINPEWKPKTEQCLNLLNQKGYDLLKINTTWNWYLAIKK